MAINFKAGQKYFNPNDGRIREITSIRVGSTKALMLTVKCMDCKVPKKPVEYEAEEFQKLIDKQIFKPLT